MQNLFLVALGGGLGSMLRYAVAVGATRLFGLNFPFGTLFVNITGSFVMGMVIELIARRFGASPELRLFIATGVLGGYTTFSAFSLDAVALYERGAAATAFLYVAISVVVSLAAVFGGLVLARHLA